jgi:hypothetical protein
MVDSRLPNPRPRDEHRIGDRLLTFFARDWSIAEAALHGIENTRLPARWLRDNSVRILHSGRQLTTSEVRVADRPLETRRSIKLD